GIVAVVTVIDIPETAVVRSGEAVPFSAAANPAAARPVAAAVIARHRRGERLTDCTFPTASPRKRDLSSSADAARGRPGSPRRDRLERAQSPHRPYRRPAHRGRTARGRACGAGAPRPELRARADEPARAG